jgi:diguanylate cyclase (GGDEF)-like protein
VARELLHLRVDAFALGLCAAVLGLPTLFSFAVAIGALFNSAVNQGWRGSGQAGLAFVVGALAWWATGRFTWQPDSNWPSTLFCLATLTLYLLAMGNVARIRIGQLRQARLALEESTQALGSANDALKLRLEDINRLQEQLREQAHRDPLTGQYNRRYLDTTLQREMIKAAREQLPITLLMVDIDHFKAINDTHGHPVGDEVLRQIGLILATHARSHDVVCRYGGEEFLLLLPQLPSTQALQRAEQLRRSAKTHVFSTEAGDIRVTLSVGVATYPDHGQTVDELLRSADHALYQAKREGRNRVVQAQAAP